MAKRKSISHVVTNGKAAVALRRQLGLNQSQFWSRVNVTQSGGSRYESGRAIPNPVQTLLTIAYGNDKQVDAMVAWLRGSVTPS